MKLEALRKFCLALPHATEDVKWGDDLCFCVGEKMFCVTGLESPESGISLKCTPEAFADLVELGDDQSGRACNPDLSLTWVARVERGDGAALARLDQHVDVFDAPAQRASDVGRDGRLAGRHEPDEIDLVDGHDVRAASSSRNPG